MSEEQPESRETRLMETLLRHALAAEGEAEDDEQRIRQLMESLRSEAEAPTETDVESSTARSALTPSARWRRWVIVPTTTAVILIGLFLLPSLFSDQQALATVERSLAAEQMPLVRHYEVTLTADVRGAEEHPYHFDLYVQQRRFAMRAPALTGDGVVWMGGDDRERWLVPRAGPVLTGEQGMLGRLARRRKALATPFLRTAAILQRLRRFYDLEMQPPARLDAFTPGDPPVDCEHVVAVRRDSATDVSIPERVELWADHELGFARRVEVKWRRTSEFHHLASAVVQLAGTPDVPDDFFRHSGHHDSDRKVIASGSDDAGTEDR